MDRSRDSDRAFSLRLHDLHWLSDPDGDGCSHGSADLVFGGWLITPGGESVDHSPSKAAWMLLRSLAGRSRLEPRHDCMLPDGGSFVYDMDTGGIGVDWTVRIVDDTAVLADLVCWPAVLSDPLEFQHLEVTLPWSEYRNQVVAYAREAITFWDSTPKRFNPPDWPGDDAVQMRQETGLMLVAAEAATSPGMFVLPPLQATLREVPAAHGSRAAETPPRVGPVLAAVAIAATTLALARRRIVGRRRRDG